MAWKSPSRQNSGTLSLTKFHLSLLGSLASLQAWRHLAAKVGTTKTEGGIGSYNKPQGCSTSVALATGPNDEEEEEEKKKKKRRYMIDLQ